MSFPPIAPPFHPVIKRWAMKPQSALILLAALACAPPAFSLRLEQVRNDHNYPHAIVDIEDADRGVVAQLYVMPGETMKLDANETPVAGAGYYQSTPGQEYYIAILSKFTLPRYRSNLCPCVLEVDKIGWDHNGNLTTVTGLRPFLLTATGDKIPILSDVNHPRMAKGRLYFKLEGHNFADYWVLTRYGQVVEVGGPWGPWELIVFLSTTILPIVLACALVYGVAGGIVYHRLQIAPDMSFIQLMQLSFTHPPFLLRKTDQIEKSE